MAVWFPVVGKALPAGFSPEQILQRLFHAAGDYRYAVPAVELCATTEHMAAYSPRRNAILLEERVVAACEKLGDQADDALAFVLGHELAHYFQQQEEARKATSFMAFDRYLHTSTRYEKAADIFGAFNAYLAGYQIEAVIPRAIEALYREYGLIGKPLPGYPPYEERQQAAQEAQQQVEELIVLFEAGNTLALLGEHQQAIAAYEHILKFYQGRETYNNLGVNYTLEAMAFSGFNIDEWVYPLEMDPQSRLELPRLDEGTRDLQLEIRLLRTRLLYDARRAFEEALQLDPSYSLARLNLATVYCLLEDYSGAIALMKVSVGEAPPFGKEWSQKKRWLEAIILAATGKDEPAARRIFGELQSSLHPGVAFAAGTNLNAMNGKGRSVGSGRNDCDWLFQEGWKFFPAGDYRPALSYEVRIGRQKDIKVSYQPLSAQYGIWIQTPGQADIYLRIEKPSARRVGPGLAPYLLPSGDYLFNRQCGVMLKLGKDGWIEKVILRQ